MTALGRLVVTGVIVVLIVIAAALFWLESGSPATGAEKPLSFDLSGATYSFMGDTFTLQNGSTTLAQGHSGLPGATGLGPVGYTLAATTSGDIDHDGAPDGVAVLYRAFGANLEYLDLFGFSDENGQPVQIASSTIYTYDSKVQSVSVESDGTVDVNILAVSAADRQNLPHYEQVPNQPQTLQFVVSGDSFAPAPGATSTTAAMYNLSEYSDPTYGFSFWYPSTLSVSASTTSDAASFPGGTAVETITVGQGGGPTLIVVNAPESTITDEPIPHASPINATKYFYNASSSEWMVTYPEGTNTGASGASTTADVSSTTIGGLPMLPSGRRFDTTIIPLSTTRFVVVTDGGGSSFTHQLAATVAPAGALVDASAQSSVLQAESTAFSQGE